MVLVVVLKLGDICDTIAHNGTTWQCECEFGVAVAALYVHIVHIVGGRVRSFVHHIRQYKTGSSAFLIGQQRQQATDNRPSTTNHCSNVNKYIRDIISVIIKFKK